MTDEDIKRLRDEARWGGPISLQRTDLAALLDEVERLRKAHSVWDDLDAQTGRHPQGPVVALVDRAERAEKVVEAVRRQMAVGGATTLSQRVKVALSAYDATNTHAKPADAPQADIVGGEASEGGGGETKTFARDEPLTWNVMGDGR